MNIGIFFLLLLPLVIVANVAVALWKFFHLFLEQYGVKHAKWIAVFTSASVFILIILWLDSSLSGTRWFGC